MPCYEFACDSCNTRFEQILPVDRRDNAVCPSCGADQVKRQVSLPAQAQIKDGRGSVPLPMSGGCGSDNCCGGMCGL